ncbi:calcium-binding protein [Tabrizicola sp. TH137]|uniref:calcium-binding protein n=1 Tax=Tabrizicola sp. TH137 TaxID=2067452 RepID=UPI00117F60C8|nr:calcium-binding protein [Tabrizicola sp. TH137]
MAVVTISNPGNGGIYWPDLFDVNFLDSGTTVSRTSRSFIVTWQSEDWGTVEIRFSGTGLTYSDGTFPDGARLVEGSLTGMTVKVGGATWLRATSLDLPAEVMDHLWLGWMHRGQYRPGDAFDFWTALLRGDDRILGSDADDDLIGGQNPGNDTIFGGAGFDWINAGAGNDVIDGGADRDTYSLQESFFDRTAFRGAVVNLQTGTATDSWGGTDTLTSVERVEGSRFADQITGSAEAERFSGLKGRDTIDGGGEHDTVRYDRDADFGGLRGVNVNLATGVARDGWGQEDTLLNIEGVFGTRFGDAITGNGADNWFIGGDGRDSINGGAGLDTMEFWKETVETGAVVDLSRSSGQVQNDGFGNVETLVSIENLYGTALGDRMTGNRLANWLEGDFGSDTLSGGAGNDSIVGGEGADVLTGGSGRDRFFYNTWDGGNPAGDTITDFASGVDAFVFNTVNFEGMDTVLRFRNGTSAGGSGESWFYFNTATRQLFWDADGTGTEAAAVMVATLTGVTALRVADFELQ